MNGNRYNSKEFYSKLIYTQNYFTPFKWKYIIPDGLLKGIDKNKIYVRNEKFYDYICGLYYKDDIDSLINGYFLFSKDYNDLKFENFSKYIYKWNFLKRNYKKIIKKDSILLPEVINNKKESNEQNKENKEIDLFRIEESKYFELYHNSRINGLTLAYIFLLNLDVLNLIKKESKETKSMIKLENYKILFRNIQLLKLLLNSKQK